MHAIQTGGNCIRNITSDEFADAAADELLDPRPCRNPSAIVDTPPGVFVPTAQVQVTAAARMIALRGKLGVTMFHGSPLLSAKAVKGWAASTRATSPAARLVVMVHC
jgi:hypothetical protein